MVVEMLYEFERFNLWGGFCMVDYVDILGCQNFNELVLCVVVGKGEIIINYVVSNIYEYVVKVRVYDDEEEDVVNCEKKKGLQCGFLIQDLVFLMMEVVVMWVIWYLVIWLVKRE